MNLVDLHFYILEFKQKQPGKTILFYILFIFHDNLVRIN